MSPCRVYKKSTISAKAESLILCSPSVKEVTLNLNLNFQHGIEGGGTGDVVGWDFMLDVEKAS